MYYWDDVAGDVQHDEFAAASQFPVGVDGQPHGAGEGLLVAVSAAEAVPAGDGHAAAAAAVVERAELVAVGVAAHQPVPGDAQLERRDDWAARLPSRAAGLGRVAGVVHGDLELPLGAVFGGRGEGGRAVVWAERGCVGGSVGVHSGHVSVAGGADECAVAEADQCGGRGIGEWGDQQFGESRPVGE